MTVICARCIEWNGSIVRSNNTSKKWHSAFSGTITHSSHALCVCVRTPLYQMRLIVIDDDIAPVCAVPAALVRCTMDISFCIIFLLLLFALVYTNIIKYARIWIWLKPIADAHLTSTQRESIVAIVCTPDRPTVRLFSQPAENGRNSITEAFSHFVFGTSGTSAMYQSYSAL